MTEILSHPEAGLAGTRPAGPAAVRPLSAQAARESDPASDVESTSDSTTDEELSPARSENFTHPRLADNLRVLLARHELKHGSVPRGVIAVVAALRGEGVTTISYALSEVLSVDFSSSVCLVDLSHAAERRRKSQAKAAPQRGVVDIVLGDAQLDDVLVGPESNTMMRVLPAGDLPFRGRAATLRSERLDDLIADLRERFDHVVLDCAPVLPGPEGLSMMRFADMHVLVSRYGSSTMAQVTATAEELRHIPALGAVLNAHRTRTPRFVRRLLGT